MEPCAVRRTPSVTVSKRDVAQLSKAQDHSAGDGCRRPRPHGHQVGGDPESDLRRARILRVQDPSGAYLGLWQAGKMQGWQSSGATDVSALCRLRRWRRAAGAPRSRRVGLAHRALLLNLAEERLVDGLGRAQRLWFDEMVPAQVPSYWMVHSWPILAMRDSLRSRRQASPTAICGFGYTTAESGT
jgi:hypothetical protein